MIGVLIFPIILGLGLHFSGTFYADYLPISTGGSFDNTGSAYNVSRILTPEYVLDPELYAAYSPLFLSTTFAITYGISFASITAVIVHTYLYHGTEIWYKFRSAREDGADVHQKMMMKYKQAPQWW